ncbi:MotA/TolQ/ExbB proton channel family protein [Acidobacteriota bacterium]
MFKAMGGTLYKYIDQGGWVMWPLLAMSLVAAAVIIERFIFLYRARIDAGSFMGQIRKVLLKRDIKQAVRICETYKGPIAAIMKAGLMKYGKPAEEVEKTIENAALREMATLERFLPVLSSISSIAPITGFFGTVIGMIASFDVLAQQGLNNPALVARGIKIALITTATGLLVAIPTLICYNWFTSWISKFVREMETSTNILMETFGEMDSLED